MDFTWADDYIKELKKETEKILTVAEESCGKKFHIKDINFTPVVELNAQVFDEDNKLVAVIRRQRVDATTAKAKSKPKLVAKQIGRGIMSSSFGVNKGKAPLRTRDYYLDCKLKGTNYSYHGYTSEQLEEPASALEKLLHPGIAARVKKKLELTKDLPAPKQYEWKFNTVTNPATFILPATTINNTPIVFNATTFFTGQNTQTQFDEVAPLDEVEEEDIEEDIYD